MMTLPEWPTFMPAFAALMGADASHYPRCTFKGNAYRLIGGSIKEGGPLATDEQYESGECSFAHLFPDGSIMRFGQQIGTLADLSFDPSSTEPRAAPPATLEEK